MTFRALTGAVLLLSGLRAQPVVPRPAPRLNMLEPCRGKVALVSFIVTSCPHCQAFARSVMEPIHESGKACVIAMAFDEGGDTAKFAREQKIQFALYRVERPVVRLFLDIGGPDKPIGTPQVAIIGKDGRIMAQSSPEGSTELLQRAVVEAVIGELSR